MQYCTRRLTSQVVAVEPYPDCFRLLQKNLSLVGGGRGLGLNVAVSDVEGAGYLVFSPGNTGGNHLIIATDTVRMASAGEGTNVPIVTGQTLMRQCGFDRVDLIKIDVEGHEEPVLNTLSEVIDQHRPRAIVFEHIGDLVSDASPIRGMFRTLRYRVYGIRKDLINWRLVPVERVSELERVVTDYVAVPEEGKDLV